MSKKEVPERKKPLVRLETVYDLLAAEKKTGETPAELKELRDYWHDVGVFSVLAIGPDNYRMFFDAFFDQNGKIAFDPSFAPPPE